MASCKDCKHYPMCGFSKYATAEKCLDFWDVSDVVKVVRCKDCVYCATKRGSRYNQLLRFCEWGEGYTRVDSDGSFFCAHGKRSKYATD